MTAIHGGKAKHDTIDSHKIAQLPHGGMPPQAYVYNIEEEVGIGSSEFINGTSRYKYRLDFLALSGLGFNFPVLGYCLLETVSIVGRDLNCSFYGNTHGTEV
jgi:hypothetical protein